MLYEVITCALFLDPETQRPFPPTAQIAEAQAKIAAKNLASLIKNSEKEKFVYHSNRITSYNVCYTKLLRIISFILFYHYRVVRAEAL